MRIVPPLAWCLRKNAKQEGDLTCCLGEDCEVGIPEPHGAWRMGNLIISQSQNATTQLTVYRSPQKRKETTPTYYIQWTQGTAKTYSKESTRGIFGHRKQPSEAETTIGKLSWDLSREGLGNPNTEDVLTGQINHPSACGGGAYSQRLYDYVLSSSFLQLEWRPTGVEQNGMRLRIALSSSATPYQDVTSLEAPTMAS